MTPLDTLRAALTQAANEPDDAVAIELGVNEAVQFTGVTWGDLRAVFQLAQSSPAAGYDVALFALREIHATFEESQSGSQVASPLERQMAGTARRALEAVGATL